MRRLSDLADRELGVLLNMTAPEVRERRQAQEQDDVFKELSLSDPEVKIMIGESRDRWAQFCNLSVEEFEKLRKEDGPNLANDFVFPAPGDVAGRFRALQDLFRGDVEFEARYPAAFETLYPRSAQKRDRVGLLLPSFGVRVLNNWVQSRVQHQDKHDVADAYTSVTWWHKEFLGRIAGPRIGPLELDDLQGVLLAVLSREEGWERGRMPKSLIGLTPVDGIELPKPSPIGITDLRLVRLLAPSILNRGLRSLLDQLHNPLAPEHVVLWKLRMLGSVPEISEEHSEMVARYLVNIPRSEIPEDALEYFDKVTQPHPGPLRYVTLSKPLRTQSALLRRHFADEDEGIAAVSFAAAALWLFLDLDMNGIHNAKSFRLAEQIEALADLLRKVSESLHQSTVDLGKLVNNRAAGRQPELPVNNYRALYNYRRGFCSLEETAEQLGITPYNSQTGRGTRAWKARVMSRLHEGVEFEKKYYPRAAAIFANANNPHIRRKARRGYRRYIVELGRKGYCHRAVVGYLLGVNQAQTQRGREIASAYLQLGSCILRRIPPLP